MAGFSAGASATAGVGAGAAVLFVSVDAGVDWFEAAVSLFVSDSVVASGLSTGSIASGLGLPELIMDSACYTGRMKAAGQTASEHVPEIQNRINESNRISQLGARCCAHCTKKPAVTVCDSGFGWLNRKSIALLSVSFVCRLRPVRLPGRRHQQWLSESCHQLGHRGSQ